MEIEVVAAAASTPAIFLLPPCTRAYHRAVIRGVDNWIYLALQRPAHWPEHSHAVHVRIIVSLENAVFRMRWRNESSGLVLEKDFNGEHVCIVPCGFLHEVEWRAEAPILMFFVDANWVERLIERPVSGVSIEPLRRYIKSGRSIAELCRLLRQRGCMRDPPKAEAVAGLGSALTAELLLANVSFQSQCTYSDPKLSQSTMDMIATYVCEHLAEKISLSDLARLVGLSPSYFGQVFRASFGESPISYLIARRVWRAREFLSAGDCSVKEIAYAVGFADQSQMARHFRSRKLLPPQSYLPHRKER